jgi:hypothetical protein
VIKLWPLEACVSSGIVVAMGEKEVAGSAEGLGGVGGHAVLNFSPFRAQAFWATFRLL